MWRCQYRYGSKILQNRFPERIAVQSGTDVVTYARLNFASNQIARTILSRFSSPRQPVALLFGRQPSSVASILGVLKSGNLYVALDSSYPPDSLRAYDCALDRQAYFNR
jgi:non-ribosomal peptide synthetase component F